MAEMPLDSLDFLQSLKIVLLRDPQVPEATSYGIYEQEGPLAGWQAGQTWNNLPSARFFFPIDD